MLQIQCVKIPVLDGRVAEVRAWVEGLSARRSEVLAALAAEGVEDEAVFLGGTERAGNRTGQNRSHWVRKRMLR